MEGSAESHWVRWHRSYEVEGSSLRVRLAIVQRLLADAIDASPPGPVRILSLCAGQGRDVIEVATHHARRDDVRGRLVELDPALAATARAACAARGLDGIEVVTGDASTTDAAAGFAPAHVLLACGIFGNISPDDIRGFVGMLPMLCTEGATIVWTRHRRPPDLTPTIRAWFAEGGCEEVEFVAPDATGAVGVGAHRLVAPPARLEPHRRLFHFVGDGRAS